MSFTHLTMSLILMPNKVGDKMLPCGTHCSCLNMSDNVLPIRTLNVRSDKKILKKKWQSTFKA